MGLLDPRRKQYGGLLGKGGGLLGWADPGQPHEDYGNRIDGTKKSSGFFGELPTNDGNVATEISIGVDFDGKETQIPALVPTLSPWEMQWLLDGKEPTPEIVDKAAQHAMERMRRGLSPFAD